jgi:hypothetical protein
MDNLHARLNLETARIPWRELARHFAAGRVIGVDSSLDLIQVAAAVAQDDAGRVQRWLKTTKLAPVSDTKAQAWQETDAVLWAVVVKPYVLVQVSAAEDGGEEGRTAP